MSTNWPEEFPHIFTEWPVPVSFNVSPGWHDLVYDLCTKLEEHAKHLHGHGCAVIVEQVKQKLGGLRFYMRYAADEMLVCIVEAEAKSFTICEACGAPGELRVVGRYHTTLCNAHFEQAKEHGARKVIWGE
jgi:hypothetical protein